MVAVRHVSCNFSVPGYLDADVPDSASRYGCRWRFTSAELGRPDIVQFANGSGAILTVDLATASGYIEFRKGG